MTSTFRYLGQTFPKACRLRRMPPAYRFRRSGVAAGARVECVLAGAAAVWRVCE